MMIDDMLRQNWSTLHSLSTDPSLGIPPKQPHEKWSHQVANKRDRYKRAAKKAHGDFLDYDRVE
jgi:hypothetical protein